MSVAAGTKAGRKILALSAKAREPYVLLAFDHALDLYFSPAGLDTEQATILHNLLDLYYQLLVTMEVLNPEVLAGMVALQAVGPRKWFRNSAENETIDPKVKAQLEGMLDYGDLLVNQVRVASFHGKVTSVVVQSLEFFRDAIDAYREDTGKGRPSYYRRIRDIIKKPHDDLGVPVVLPDIARQIEAFVEEAAASRGDYLLDIKPKTLKAGRSILEKPPTERARLLVLALRRLTVLKLSSEEIVYFGGWPLEESALANLVSQLFRAKLPLSDDNFTDCVQLMTRSPWSMSSKPLLGHLEKVKVERGLMPKLTKALEKYRDRLKKGRMMYAEDRRELQRVEDLLQGLGRGFFAKHSEWAKQVAGDLKAMEKTARSNWEALFEHSLTAKNKSRPSAAGATPFVLLRAVGGLGIMGAAMDCNPS